MNKFGKRVFMGNYQLTNREVFDLHMQQIQNKGSMQHSERDAKIREEHEFSRFVHD